MSVDFTNELNISCDEIQKPKPLPAGTYFMTATGKRLGTSTTKGTKYAEVTFEISSLGPDLTEEDLEGVKYLGRSMKQTFWLTEDSLYRILSFFKAASLDIAGRSIGDVLEDIIGTNVLAEVSQVFSENVDEDGEQIIYSNISKFLIAE